MAELVSNGFSEALAALTASPEILTMHNFLNKTIMIKFSNAVKKFNCVLIFNADRHNAFQNNQLPFHRTQPQSQAEERLTKIGSILNRAVEASEFALSGFGVKRFVFFNCTIEEYNLVNLILGETHQLAHFQDLKREFGVC